MKERLLALRPILLRVIGYPLFFGFFFVTFLYATFPYDRLKEAIIAAAEAPRVSPSGRSVPATSTIDIQDLGPTFLPGLEFRGVTVTSIPERPTDRETRMELDKVRVRVSLLGLLTRYANVSFSVEGLGGEIEGEASTYFGTELPGLRALKMELRDLRLGDIAPVAAMVGLPMRGTLAGTVDVSLPEGRTSLAEGAVRLTVNALSIGDGRAQYQLPGFGGVTIEQIRAGNLEVNVNVRRGAALLERVQAHSAEFDLQMDGRIDLRPNFGDSAMNIGLRFRLTDVYRNKSEVAGRIMTVMDMVPDLRAARRPDGLIAYRCTGTFSGRTACAPAPAGTALGGGNTAMPPGFAP